MMDRSLGSQNTARQEPVGIAPSMGEVGTLPPERSSARSRFRVGESILGRYRVTGELGQGGMGLVYRCVDEVAGVDVALKALPPELSHDSGEMEEVRDNFRMVASLVHQNIASARTLEKDPATGDVFLVMECVDGINLRQWRKRDGQASACPQVGGVPFERVLPVLRQIAAALDFAHSQKIIHRDVKPANVMLRPDGTVKVLDFGLAAQIHTSLSRVSRVHYGTSGTGPYMAPEQWNGQRQDAATDQYALGATAYELLAGRCPFENHDPAILRQSVLGAAPAPVAGLTKAQNAALQRALSKNPALRFASCREFVEALEGRLSSRAAWCSSSRAAGETARKRTLLTVAAAVVLAVSAGTYWQIRRSDAKGAQAGAGVEKERVRSGGSESPVAVAPMDAPPAVKTLSAVPGTNEAVAVTNKAAVADAEKMAEEAMAKQEAERAAAEKRAADEKAARAAAETKRLKVEAEKQKADEEKAALAGVRRGAEGLREVANLAKTAAEKEQASAEAKALYDTGERSFSRAAELYAKGDFSSASNLWTDAAAAYVEARKQALTVQAARAAEAKRLVEEKRLPAPSPLPAAVAPDEGRRANAAQEAKTVALADGKWLAAGAPVYALSRKDRYPLLVLLYASGIDQQTTAPVLQMVDDPKVAESAKGWLPMVKVDLSSVATMNEEEKQFVRQLVQNNKVDKFPVALILNGSYQADYRFGAADLQGGANGFCESLKSVKEKTKQ